MSKVSIIVILLLSFVAAGSTLKCIECSHGSPITNLNGDDPTTTEKVRLENTNRSECYDIPPPFEFIEECNPNAHPKLTSCRTETQYQNDKIVGILRQCQIPIYRDNSCGRKIPNSAPKDFVKFCRCYFDGCYNIDPDKNKFLTAITTPKPDPGESITTPIPSGMNETNKRKPKRNGGQGEQKSSSITIYILLVIAPSAFLRI